MSGLLQSSAVCTAKTFVEFLCAAVLLKGGWSSLRLRSS